jgi:hypothetical protein
MDCVLGTFAEMQWLRGCPFGLANTHPNAMFLWNSQNVHTDIQPYMFTKQQPCIRNLMNVEVTFHVELAIVDEISVKDWWYNHRRQLE